jgi:hypothetical protein
MNLGRVIYTPNRFLKEVVLARKLLGEDGQSQMHTQLCHEVMLAMELLCETWFGVDG